MAQRIEDFKSTFNDFVQFAQLQKAAGQKSAIARIGDRVDISSGALAGHSIQAAKSDSTRGIFKWFRSADDKAANNKTRDIFRDAVFGMFGGESRLPEAVKKAMILADFDKGKPLTARRILAVKTAIEANEATLGNWANDVKNQLSELKVEMKKALIVTQRDVEENRGAVIDRFVDQIGDDPDMITLLKARGCTVAKAILTSNADLRPEEQRDKRFNALKANLDELRSVTRGNKQLFDVCCEALGALNGKSYPPGMIKKMFEIAGKTDLSGITKLPANASSLQIAKFFCAVDKATNDILNKSELKTKMYASVGPNEKVAINNLLLNALLSRCSKSTLNKINTALHSEDFAEFQFACHAMGLEEETIPANIMSEVKKGKEGKHYIIKAAFSIALTMSPTGIMRESMAKAIFDMTGQKDTPYWKGHANVGPGDFLDIYNAIEKHMLAEHTDVMEKFIQDARQMQQA